MRRSRIKSKLRRGQPVLLTALQFTDAAIYEMASLMGFDGLWMDLEHHYHSLETAGRLMRAARVGSADIVARPAKGEFMRMSRLLEAGAQGIMYPRCDDAEEAAEVVRWAKFAPLGQRGFDGANPDVPYYSMPIATYLEQANEETLIVIQLESPQALDQAEQIAMLDGVDVLMLGPADFSILSGVPGQWNHALLQGAIQRIADASRAAGKQWGCPCFSTEHARQLLDLGARFLCHGADFLMVKQGLEQLQRDFAKLEFTFDNRLGHGSADGEP
jgi:4-hydroxy-2-oxoheptanedioate aldolase